MILLPTKRFRDMSPEEKAAHWHASEIERKKRAASYYAHLWQPGRVYAALFRDGEVVKVGFTISLNERIDQLSRRFGEPLNLINSIPAYRQQERWLHEYFHRSYRISVDGSRETYAYDAVRPDLNEMWRTGKTPAKPRILQAIADGHIGVPAEPCQ